MKPALSAAALIATASLAVAGPELYTNASFGFLTGVSNEGTAVGPIGAEIGLWNPLSSLTVNIGGNSASGEPKISADGRYISGSTFNVDDGRTEMGRYDRTTSAWTTLGGVGGYSGSTRSSAWGISPDGSAVVGFGYGPYTGSSTGTFTGIHPMVWKDGVVTDYAHIANASSINRIMAANDSGIYAANGRIVLPGQTAQSSGAYYFPSGPGSQTALLSDGDILGEPRAISDDGALIAGSGNFASSNGMTPATNRPYLYDTTSGGVTFIDSIAAQNGNPLPASLGNTDGLLTGMTGDGSTSIGFFRARNSFNTPLIDKVWGFIYTADAGVQPFEDFMADLGITDLGDYWYVPTSISNDGSVIAGFRYAHTGAPVYEGFMITAVPAPASGMIFAGASLLATRRRRA